MFAVESERSGNNETIQSVSPVFYSYEIQPEVAKFLKSEHHSLSKILAYYKLNILVGSPNL